MNIFHGHINRIHTHGNLSLVRMKSGTIELSVIIIETPESVPYLKMGNPIRALFKETEVIICTSENISISVGNKIPCLVKNIEEGNLLSRVELDFESNIFSALIPADSRKILDLKIGDKVIAMVKTNEIMLSE